MLFDLHRITAQYYIQDISDIHPAVDQRKPTLLAITISYVCFILHISNTYVIIMLYCQEQVFLHTATKRLYANVFNQQLLS